MLHTSFSHSYSRSGTWPGLGEEVVEDWLISLQLFKHLYVRITHPCHLSYKFPFSLQRKSIFSCSWILDLAIWFALACVEWSDLSRGLKCILIGPLELLPCAIRTDLTYLLFPVIKRTWRVATSEWNPMMEPTQQACIPKYSHWVIELRSN